MKDDTLWPLWLIVTGIAALVAGLYADATWPDCPDGSDPRWGRYGWVCVVPPKAP